MKPTPGTQLKIRITLEIFEKSKPRLPLTGLADVDEQKKQKVIILF